MTQTMCLAVGTIVGAMATTFAAQSGQPALNVTAAPEQCAKATAIEVWRKSVGRPPGRSDQPEELETFSFGLLGPEALPSLNGVVQESVGPECQWSFSGLPDGKYIVRLVRPDGSGGSGEVTVTTGSLQTIAIPTPAVTVTGVVTLEADRRLTP